VRTVGLDLGSRRIGVAVSDSEGTVATPHTVLERSGDVGADHAEVAAIVREVGAGRVVVGVPRSLDGTTGPAAQAVLDEVAQLAAAVGVPVATHDERLTTVTAERALRAGNVRRRRRRQVVDQVAATVILQAWLDAQSRS